MEENTQVQNDVEISKKLKTQMQVNTKNSKNKKIMIKLLSESWIVVYAVILFLFTYTIGTSNIGETFGILKIISIVNKQYIIAGYLITLALLIIGRALLKNTFISNIVVTGITTIISIISYYKYSLLNQPFVPNDILLAGNANQIASFGLSMPSINVIFCVVTLGLVLYFEYLIEKKYKINEKKLNWKKEWYRIPLLFIGCILIFFLCFDAKRFEKIKINNDLGNLYNYSGAVATFFMHLGDLYTKTPEDYSKENIEKIEAQYSIVESKIAEKVNVIFIMNESFSDPTKIEGVEYSKDPLGDIRELAKIDKNCKIGNCITPSFGGGTSLPEFEALTGLTSFYIEKQIFPYTSYITSDMNSIVREYNKNGYETIGLHTNTKTFYNRNNVYKFLGFNKTVFEEDINNPIYKAGNISDEEFKNQIINKFEENKNTKKFIFGVTMQNHMPYKKKEYENYDIAVTSEQYTKTNINSLKNYVQGVYDSNKLYVELVEYLKGYEEPTILVMFGDHLPSLEKGIFYKNSEYSTIDLYETPYIMWSNCNIDLTTVPEYITPGNLGLTLLKLSGNSLPWYLKPFEEIYRKYPIINNQIVVDKNLNVLKKDEIENIELIRNANILQYDLLIKKKYIPCIK